MPIIPILQLLFIIVSYMFSTKQYFIKFMYLNIYYDRNVFLAIWVHIYISFLNNCDQLKIIQQQIFIFFKYCFHLVLDPLVFIINAYNQQYSNKIKPSLYIKNLIMQSLYVITLFSTFSVVLAWFIHIEIKKECVHKILIVLCTRVDLTRLLLQYIPTFNKFYVYINLNRHKINRSSLSNAISEMLIK